jgi:RimJ/RimL family protein N-acetyltransferase
MIETDRLILRRWRQADLEPFAVINADPRVMEFFPSTLTFQETADLIKRAEEKFARDGFCFWAAQLKSTSELVGMVGLNIPAFEAHFTPCVEVGWRLKFERWGKGLASEAGIASLKYGFETLQLDEIVAFTTKNNQRSRRVMERIGMAYDPSGDFLHPKLPEGHPLAPHVLYRVGR